MSFCRRVVGGAVATVWALGSFACSPAESTATGPPSQTEAAPNDALGMTRELGPDTWARCAEHLALSGARVYELSHVRSNTMPLSPYAGPLELTYLPTGSLPGTTQVFNMEVLNENANPSQQGTQMDALGHFGYLEEPWDGTSTLAVGGARYYGGLTQEEVKPTPDSPLLRLGMDEVPPIVTTAVFLDARTHVNEGQPMEAGEVVTPEQIQAMLKAQGLEERGILPGDVVYIYTGWSEHYRDPDTEKVYYSMAPGLSYAAAQYLAERRVVAVGLDAPFVDAIAEGQLAGRAGPPPGSPEGKVFPIHHYLLSQAGIHTLENVKLDEVARDGVSTACTMVLPVREKGAAGAPIRPVAIGAPAR